ncbi:glycosyltransferase family 2 protein [Flavobacterium myungsuense]|uniref:Glycosyltransferase family 2 protein n=1 Tax=Flavobacterium myungsuense TaxID=651823 RepID=A0ABW3J4D1_9FLAO
MSKFSVIIPLYNKEKFIENTLNSVLNQSFTDFELIIVNDGSTDTSQEKVLQYSDSRIRYFYKENEGVSSARNYGISVAQSEYIAFIDADDYWLPDFLKEMLQNIYQFPNEKVFTAAFEIETLNKIIPAVYSIKKLNDCQVVNYFEASKKESVIWSSCAVFHKSVFEKIGNFDANLKNAEDVDLWIRIGLIYPIVFNWKVLAKYVYDTNSLSKNYSYSVNPYFFNKYIELEKSNLSLKKLLDYNRFSIALKCKLNNDMSNFYFFYEGINLMNLSIKKRVLLHLQPFVLKILIKINHILARIGLMNSVFK